MGSNPTVQPRRLSRARWGWDSCANGGYREAVEDYRKISKKRNRLRFCGGFARHSGGYLERPFTDDHSAPIRPECQSFRLQSQSGGAANSISWLASIRATGWWFGSGPGATLSPPLDVAQSCRNAFIAQPPVPYPVSPPQFRAGYGHHGKQIQ